MTAVLSDIERRIRPGTVIPKPQAHGEFKFKKWGKRRGEHRTPGKPYEKGITISEWEQAAGQLMGAGDFSFSWFNRYMSKCAKEGSCNFTTIGGVFELLGYAEYHRGVYLKQHRDHRSDEP